MLPQWRSGGDGANQGCTILRGSVPAGLEACVNEISDQWWPLGWCTGRREEWDWEIDVGASEEWVKTITA